MAKRSYTTDEILAEHDYVRPHVEAGYRLHGGFDANGRYISPRSLHRWRAIEHWTEGLRARGQPLVAPSEALKSCGVFPSEAQQKFLLDVGLDQTLWDFLTLTGIAEAHAKRLTTAVAPNFQDVVVEDISDTAIAHLNKGLLRAHGLDESGDGDRGEGGHDTMWFAVRDLLFGKGAFPEARMPDNPLRLRPGRSRVSLPPEYENWIASLMNLLAIEIRAEAVFRFSTTLMRDPTNFPGRGELALHAAELVERIRQDEQPHIGYLTVFFSELRSFAMRDANGRTVPGAQVIDPLWRLANWHAVAETGLERKRRRAGLIEILERQPDGDALILRFDALERKEVASRQGGAYRASECRHNADAFTQITLAPEK